MLNDAKAEDWIYACILSTSSKSFAVRSHCEYLTSVVASKLPQIAKTNFVFYAI